MRDARSRADGAQRALDQQTRRARQLAEVAAEKAQGVEDLRRRLEEAEGERRQAEEAAAEAERAVAAGEAELADALERVGRAEAGSGHRG